MPEQPADPLHYEMKIPPEPHSSKDNEDAEKSDDHDPEKKSDTNVVRGDDKSQTRRSSE
jgi:hypothetical protein